ncbi:hypothetical protein [Laspinema palackyanum]|uniref:hypothetical protein n=1 Tax=Laspinema palackyanum TaxID=3231601 RepID=UPI00349F0EB9
MNPIRIYSQTQRRAAGRGIQIHPTGIITTPGLIGASWGRIGARGCREGTTANASPRTSGKGGIGATEDSKTIRDRKVIKVAINPR